MGTIINSLTVADADIAHTLRAHDGAPLRDLANYVMERHSATITRLLLPMRNPKLGERPWETLLDDPDLSVYLLGWRPGHSNDHPVADITPIHGHGASHVYVACLEGEVDDDRYMSADGMTPLAQGAVPHIETRVLAAGGGIYLPVGYIHDMRCDDEQGRGFAATMHFYRPGLRKMEYYAFAPGGRLMRAGGWTDERLVA